MYAPRGHWPTGPHRAVSPVISREARAGAGPGSGRPQGKLAGSMSPGSTWSHYQAVRVLAAHGLLAALRDDAPEVLHVARFPADGEDRTALLSSQGCRRPPLPVSVGQVALDVQRRRRSPARPGPDGRGRPWAGAGAAPAGPGGTRTRSSLPWCSAAAASRRRSPAVPPVFAERVEQAEAHHGPRDRLVIVSAGVLVRPVVVAFGVRRRQGGRGGRLRQPGRPGLFGQGGRDLWCNSMTGESEIRLTGLRGARRGGFG